MTSRYNVLFLVWPGQPIRAHWGIADPAAVHTSGVDRTRAFARAFQELNARISIFVNLRLEVLDTFALQRELDQIGKFDVAPTE